MKAIRIATHLLGWTMAACAATSTFAADIRFKTAPAAGYAKGINVSDPALQACDWNAKLVSSLVKETKGAVAINADAASPGKTLHIYATKFVAPVTSEKRDNLIVVRADVKDGDKLVATIDVKQEKSLRSGKAYCDTLKDMAGDIADELGEWLNDGKFADCGEGCAGIHPDDPIFLDPQIQIVDKDAINETVVECGWLKYMPGKVIKAVNESEHALRAKLQLAEGDISKVSGRKLNLKVSNIHVLGGGGWTGPKWISMQGDLTDGGLLAASFEIKYLIKSAKFTACGVLEAGSESLSEEIALWLKGPRLNSKL
jgi:hypothetical protein